MIGSESDDNSVRFRRVDTCQSEGHAYSSSSAAMISPFIHLNSDMISHVLSYLPSQIQRDAVVSLFHIILNLILCLFPLLVWIHKQFGQHTQLCTSEILQCAVLHQQQRSVFLLLYQTPRCAQRRENLFFLQSEVHFQFLKLQFEHQQIRLCTKTQLYLSVSMK